MQVKTKYVLVRVNWTNTTLQILQAWSQSQSLFRAQSETRSIPLFLRFQMLSRRVTPHTCQLPFPPQADPSSPAGIKGGQQTCCWSWKQNLSRQQQGDAVAPLSAMQRHPWRPYSGGSYNKEPRGNSQQKQHKLFHDPHKLQIYLYLDNKTNPCIHPGKLMPCSSFSTKMSLCCQTSNISEHWD